MYRHILKNGSRNVITSVSIPEHLHQFARGHHISLSGTLKRSLELELSKAESGVAL